MRNIIIYHTTVVLNLWDSMVNNSDPMPSPVYVGALVNGSGGCDSCFIQRPLGNLVEQLKEHSFTI